MVSWGFSTEGHPEVIENSYTSESNDTTTTTTTITSLINSEKLNNTYELSGSMGHDDVIDDGSVRSVVVGVGKNRRRNLSSDDALTCMSQSGPPSLSSSSSNPGSSLTPAVALASEENYEGFGFVEESSASQGSSSCSSAPSPTNGQTLSFNNNKSLNSPTLGATIGRNTWLRTSLRRPQSSSSSSKTRQLGSNALASQLYRSGSFNSSGRGSTCDATEDMYSDVSLEDDVIDLNNRVRMIQEQMDALVDNQSSLSISGERYARVKEENATLQARILMLEEAAKDCEVRNEEKMQLETRRNRELIARLEREKQLELENYAIKVKSLEVENCGFREQVQRVKEQLSLAKGERERMEAALEEANEEIERVRMAERQALMRENEMRIMLDNAKEELAARSRDRQRIEELLMDVSRLTVKNKNLEELRDELQAANALHVGRELLLLNPPAVDTNSRSLAAELSDNRDNVDSGDTNGNDDKPRTMAEMRQLLREQQEVNAQLRTYIDNILLNIVENYPQLLEVKQPN